MENLNQYLTKRNVLMGVVVLAATFAYVTGEIELSGFICLVLEYLG